MTPPFRGRGWDDEGGIGLATKPFPPLPFGSSEVENRVALRVSRLRSTRTGKQGHGILDLHAALRRRVILYRPYGQSGSPHRRASDGRLLRLHEPASPGGPRMVPGFRNAGGSAER